MVDHALREADGTALPAETDIALARLDYIADLAAQLRDEALATGSRTLGGLLDLASREAQIQLQSRAPGRSAAELQSGGGDTARETS